MTSENITREKVEAASDKAVRAIRDGAPNAQALSFEANRLWTIWRAQQEAKARP